MSGTTTEWESVSTSTSGFDAPPPRAHDPRLSRLASDTFDKTAEYVRGECSATLAQYSLLEEMNRRTVDKYSEMGRVVDALQRRLAEHGEAHAAGVEPHLRHLHLIEESVDKLERAAYSLDNYTKLLHIKFKNITKR